MLGSVVDHSLWGVPGWLKDSIRALGAQGMPSPALPSSGRSLGEERSLAVLCFPCLVQRGQRVVWARVPVTGQNQALLMWVRATCVQGTGQRQEGKLLPSQRLQVWETEHLGGQVGCVAPWLC